MSNTDKEIKEAVNPQDLGLTPEQQENFEDIEKQFAVKAVQQMETYWKVLQTVKGSELRLTKYDDEIYEHFKKDFPEIDVSKPIDEDAMKSKEGKERWRKFITVYEKKINDFNFGTLVRADPKKDYDEHSTIFAVRMQFYAFEIARNKEGLNDWVYLKEHAKPERPPQ